ncbi:MAG: hypothetical protein AAFP69_11040 [Planctomycetota bacterium]
MFSRLDRNRRFLFSATERLDELPVVEDRGLLENKDISGPVDE